MFTISGKTFEHRETIKALGGRFDGTNKTWKVANLTDAAAARLRALAGVIVTGSGDTAPGMPDAPAPAPVRPQVPSVMSGAVNTYGDDMTYLNPRSLSFFGFSSLRAMTDFVRSIPKYNGSRGCAWDDDADFTGTWSMDEALNLADNGWSDGVNMAKEVLDLIEGKNAVQRTAVYSVAGGRVNVGRMLSGAPNHMIKRPKMPAKKIITLYCDAGTHWKIEAKNLIIRAACVGAIVDILEENGYSCEIVSFMQTKKNSDKNRIFTKIKEAGEKLNINDLVFALGHPSYLRRFGFACIACNYLHSHFYLSNYGYPVHKNADTLGANEFLIGNLSSNPGGNMREKAATILRTIIPDNLPITINAE